MIVEFLRLVSFARRQTNINTKKWLLTNVCVITIFSALAYLEDVYMSWGFGWNTIRAITAIIVGFSLFLITYSIHFMIQQKREHKKVNKLIQMNYERLSVNQRISLSFVIGFVVSILFLVVAPTGSVVYTNLFSMLIMFLLYLGLFIKPTKDEVDLFTQGIEDNREIRLD